MNNISTFGIISSFEQCLMGGELPCPNVSILNDSKTLMFTPQNNYAQYLYIEPLESNANVKFVSFSPFRIHVNDNQLQLFCCGKYLKNIEMLDNLF